MFHNKSEPTKNQADADTAVDDKEASPAEIVFSDRMLKSVIDKNLVIVGNAFSVGNVLVEGEFQGDIQSASLKVGVLARVTGNLKADEITISGHVEGTIRGRHIILEANSHIVGDIYHETLSIANGAVFRGKSYQAGDGNVEVSKAVSENAPKKNNSTAPEGKETREPAKAAG